MPAADSDAVAGATPAPATRARTRRTGAKPSMYDVADLAGVSHQTVSRVLNGHPNIRESTRARVLRAIEEVNYTPSSIARALATNRTRRIGVLVDNPVQYGPNSTLRGIEEAARAMGYAVSSISVGDGPDLGMDAGLRHLLLQGVDALTVIAPRYSTLHVLTNAAHGLPTLIVTAEPEQNALTAAVDQYAGAAMAVDHLIALGHRDIFHLAGPLDWVESRGRAQAWRDRLTAAGLPARPPAVGDWTSDFGYDLGRRPDALGDATAVFAANDQMALGLIHGLHSRGIRVPQDISVVGFDDVPDARHFLPPLTTIRQDFHALGTLSVTMLIGLLQGDDSPRNETIQPELIIRESAAAPRPGAPG